jgi:hypothetical protein
MNKPVDDNRDLAAEVGNSLDVKLPAKVSYQEMMTMIAGHVNHLIDKNFQGLLQLLYRIDIPEKTLREHLAKDENGDTGSIIAIMMIERIKQKMESRKKYSKPATDIPEADQW